MWRQHPLPSSHHARRSRIQPNPFSIWCELNLDVIVPKRYFCFPFLRLWRVISRSRRETDANGRRYGLYVPVVAHPVPSQPTALSSLSISIYAGGFVFAERGANPVRERIGHPAERHCSRDGDNDHEIDAAYCERGPSWAGRDAHPRRRDENARHRAFHASPAPPAIVLSPRGRRSRSKGRFSPPFRLRRTGSFCPPQSARASSVREATATSAVEAGGGA